MSSQRACASLMVNAPRKSAKRLVIRRVFSSSNAQVVLIASRKERWRSGTSAQAFCISSASCSSDSVMLMTDRISN